MIKELHKILLSLDSRLSGVEGVCCEIATAMRDMPHVVVQEDGSTSIIGKTDYIRPAIEALFADKLRAETDIIREKFNASVKLFEEAKQALLRGQNQMLRKTRLDVKNERIEAKRSINDMILKAEERVKIADSLMESIKKSAAEINNTAVLLPKKRKFNGEI